MNNKAILILSGGLLLLFPALAQDEAKKADKTPNISAAADDRAVTTPEKQQSMLLEGGVRWVLPVAGDFNTYRSVVNLGEGWRVTRLEYNLVKPSGRIADEVHLRASDWGGDPYNTAALDISKRRVYSYRGFYSNMAYFNYLPSFANPGLGTLGTGIYMNQRAYDTRMKNFDNELQIVPGGILVPYVSYARNSADGSGISNLVVNNNEYPLRNDVTWSQDTVRGGVRLMLKRFHGSIEQGTLNFKDDQGLYSGGPTTGNRTTPYNGQQLRLQDGNQFYYLRGDGPFTTAQITGNPWDWLDLSAFFVRSKPSSNSNFTQNEVGNFVSPSLFFFTQGRDTFYGNARMPRTSWSGSAEVRPFSRLRIREIYETDRMVNDTNGVLQTLVLPTNATTPVQGQQNYLDRLEVNQSRQQIEVLYDLTRGILARGGYRYEFGRSLVRGGNLNPQPLEPGEMKRHVGLAGVQIRPFSKLQLNADLEVGDGVKTYYRTGLYDTVRFRAQGRYTLPKDLTFRAIYSRFNNKNPNTGINYDFHSQQINANMQWLPGGGRKFSLLADYTRSEIKSDIQYLVPQMLSPARSLYRDNAHTGTMLMDVLIPFKSTYQGRFTFGGSFVQTSGSRPSNYYTPQGRLSVPFADKVDVFVDWRYWGLSQRFYGYEGFRTHSLMGGIRFRI